MGGKGKKRTDRRKGVPFKMMFRHHLDPDYYDPKANDKIFVPDMAALSEEQRRIVETFPERDRGLYKEGGAVVEEDPLEAAVKKIKLRKEQRMQDKREELATKDGKKRVHFTQDEDDSEDSAEYFEGS